MVTDGTISTFLANSLLDHVHGDGAYASPAAVYVGLTTVVPTVDDSGASVTEPDATWTNYARQQLLAGSHPSAANRLKTYNAILDFGTAETTADTNCVGWFTSDSNVIGAGNLLFVGTTDGTIIVQDGNPVSVPAGQFKTRFDETFGAVP